MARCKRFHRFGGPPDRFQGIAEAYPDARRDWTAAAPSRDKHRSGGRASRVRRQAPLPLPLTSNSSRTACGNCSISLRARAAGEPLPSQMIDQRQPASRRGIGGDCAPQEDASLPRSSADFPQSRPGRQCVGISRFLREAILEHLPRLDDVTRAQRRDREAHQSARPRRLICPRRPKDHGARVAGRATGVNVSRSIAGDADLGSIEGWPNGDQALRTLYRLRLEALASGPIWPTLVARRLLISKRHERQASDGRGPSRADPRRLCGFRSDRLEEEALGSPCRLCGLRPSIG